VARHNKPLINKRFLVYQKSPDGLSMLTTSIYNRFHMKMPIHQSFDFSPAHPMSIKQDRDYPLICAINRRSILCVAKMSLAILT